MDRFSPTNDSQDAAVACAFSSALADDAGFAPDDAADQDPAPWSAAWLQAHLEGMRENAALDARHDREAREAAYSYGISLNGSSSSGLSIRNLDGRDANDGVEIGGSHVGGPQGCDCAPSGVSIPGNDEELFLGETVCRAGYNAVLNAPTLRAAAVAMRAHYVSCAICGSDEHVVVSDRLHLGKTNAACCEGKAA